MSYDGLKPQIMFFSETKNTEFGWVNSLPSTVSTLLPSQAKLCPCTEWKTLLSHSCKNTASFFPLEHGVCSQLVPGHPGTFTLGGDSCAPGAMFCGSFHSVPCCHPFFPVSWFLECFQVFLASYFLSAAQMALCQVKMGEATSLYSWTAYFVTGRE